MRQDLAAPIILVGGLESLHVEFLVQVFEELKTHDAVVGWSVERDG